MIASPDPLNSLIDQFWESLPPVWHRIRIQIAAAAAESAGITGEQFHLLRHIRKGRDSVSALAEVKQTSRPAISQALEALVQKGLVTRHQETDDRRFMRLALTPAGENLVSAVFQKNRAWMAARLARLEPGEAETIRHALAALGKAFQEDNLAANR